mgnify:CR=1 FL=1
MANQKLTREELEKLQGIQQKNSALIQELGQIGLAEINLEKRQENAEKYLEELREEEGTFAKELEDKYGTGSIDLEKGEFIPSEKVEEVTPAPATETKTVK